VGVKQALLSAQWHHGGLPPVCLQPASLLVTQPRALPLWLLSRSLQLLQPLFRQLAAAPRQPDLLLLRGRRLW
jgi:hypothetical protein